MKNPKRFKLCFIFCIFMWLTTIWHFLLLSSNDLWLLIDGPYFPDFGKTCVFVLTILLFFCSVVKTDYLLTEINNRLEALKMFHILSLNLKSLHQLTEKNYKRLALFSRILIVLLINYGAIFFSILLPLLWLTLAILSKRMYMLMHFILFLPLYVNLTYVSLAACCICYIYFVYYSMRFNQLNDQLKSIIRNQLFEINYSKSIIRNGRRRIISNSKEKLTLQLINQHESLSNEVNKFNLLFGRSAAALFISFALIKITAIYLTIFMKHILTRILVCNVFIIMFIFGFGSSILFSYQINSAKSSYKMMHSVVCNYKMSIRLRLKVKNLIKILIIF